MKKVLTSICLALAMALSTVFSLASMAFGQEKVSSPAETATVKQDKSPAPELWRQVEIIRTLLRHSSSGAPSAT